MGGSKTKTYTDLQSQALFDEQNDLMSKEMVRIFALNKTIDSKVFNKSMLLASQKYYAAEKFDALGIASEIVGAVKEITEYGVTSYLSGKVDSPEVFYFSSKDVNDNAIALLALKIKQQLETSYNTDTSYEKVYSYSYTNEIKYNVDDYNTLVGNSVPEEITIDIVTNKYEINTNEWYQLYNDNITGNNVSMELLDKDDLPTGTIIQVSIAEDNRTIYACNYSYDDSGTTTLADGTYFFKDDIIAEASEWHFLMLPLKDEGEIINDAGYVKAVLNDFGLGNGALDESLANNDIKRSLISHSTSLDDTDYADIIEEVYGADGNRKDVTLQTDYYNILYHNVTRIEHYGEGESDVIIEYKISIDDNEFYLDGKYVMMLPLEELRKEPMNIRYKHIKDTLRIWANTSVTVHLKWYQTGFFKFLTIIIAAVISVITENPTALLWAIGAPIVLGLISKIFGPEVAAIVAIAYIAFTFDFSKATNIETFSTVANIANQMSQVYFTIESKSINKDLNRISEEDKAAHKAISEMKRQAIYMPFDSYSSYYDGMYSVATEAYTTVYNTAFNFDIMLKPKLGVING